MKRFPQLLLILTILVSSVVLLPFRAGVANAADPTPWPHNLFLPFTSGEKAGYSVQGRVVDEASKPVAGVTITDDWGMEVQTDAQGNFEFKTLRGGEHALAAYKEGLFFSPSVQELNVSADAQAVTFVAVSANTELLTNTSFEQGDKEIATGWTFPSADLYAYRTNTGARSGDWSVFTGNLGGRTDDPNPYGYSSVRTATIRIPDNATAATLSFWAFPLTTEAVKRPAALKPGQLSYDSAPLGDDAHYALIIDPNAADASSQSGQKVLAAPLWDLYDNPSQVWRAFTFNLIEYKGRDIQIEIGTFNDGFGGISAMYVDDVSLAYSTGGGGSQPDPAPQQPQACENLLANSGFENNGSWVIRDTTYPARYSGAQAFMGTRSMSTGIPDPSRNRRNWDNGSGRSEIYQDVDVPRSMGDNDTLWLNFWFYPELGLTAQQLAEGEGALAPQASPDFQYFYVLNLDDTRYDSNADYYMGYKVIYAKEDSWGKAASEKAWTPWDIKINPRRYSPGDELRIVMGTYNDGTSGSAAMYLDEVAVNLCDAGSTPQPVTTTPTATPTTPTVTATTTSTVAPTVTPLPDNCDEEIINGDFEDDNGWFIPWTAYSARYSSRKVSAGDWSMMAGIWYEAHNRYSYSDFRQRIRIPDNVDSAWLTFDLYTKSTEWRYRNVPALPDGYSPLAGGTLTGDVQYLLVLDRYLNWTDTLMWDRMNDREWTTYEANMRYYRGDTINLQFGVYNDGWDGVTSMFVDNVSLVTCND